MNWCLFAGWRFHICHSCTCLPALVLHSIFVGGTITIYNFSSSIATKHKNTIAVLALRTLTRFDRGIYVERLSMTSAEVHEYFCVNIVTLSIDRCHLTNCNRLLWIDRLIFRSLNSFHRLFRSCNRLIQL